MIVYSYVIASVALTVAQGSATPPSIREGNLSGHSNSSLLYTLLHVAGFSETCVSGVLDYCSSAQEEAHYPSLMQEIQDVQVELQEVKAEAQEGKEVLQQEIKRIMQQINLMVNILEFRPRHCKDLLDSGDTESGLREVFPNPSRPLHQVIVYCDQDVDGGGWTVFQRRINNTVRQDFYKDWTDYKSGFGDLEGEFWMGLDLLHKLTKTEQELRIDLNNYEGEHRWAKYGAFQVGSAATNYRLIVGRYSGDAGDVMAYHNGSEFSTHDADHDKHSSNCAEEFHGAWWYNSCYQANLNGYHYVGDNSSGGKGITWNKWRGSGYSLMRTAMMFRPAQ